MAGAPPEVAVGVLGNLEVHVDGTPVAIGHARRKAVPAVLLVEANRVVPADRLIDRVWGEEPPSRARSVLRTHLSKLRQALVRTGITITWHDTGYLLTVDPGSVDLHRFRRLLVQARGAGGPRCRRSRPDRLGVGLRQARGRAAGADHVGRRTPAGRTRGRTGGACAVPVRPPGRRAGALPAHPAAAGRGVGADPDPALRELHLVAGKRMPVVLDNAATSEQVLPGSPTCTVLVTGRGALLTDGSTLAGHFRDGRAVLLDVATGAAVAVEGWGDRVTVVTAAPTAFPDQPMAALVRPDGQVAWVALGTADTDALRAVLTIWLGPPS